MIRTFLIATVSIFILSCSSKKELKDRKVGVDIGDLAPQIVLNNLNDSTVQLSSYLGRTILIDFWASWCSPCRYENRNLVNTYLKFKNIALPQKSSVFAKGKIKGLTIFSVSLDNNKLNWKRAIQQDKLEWSTHVSDLKYWNNVAAKAYEINSIPSNFLIDENGVIIAKNLFGKNLDDFLEKLTQKNVK